MSYFSQAYFTSNIKILETIFCIFKAKNLITNELMTLFCFEDDHGKQLEFAAGLIK